MSTAAGSSGITNQVWQRIIRQGDTNADKALSKGEIEALKAAFKDKVDIDQIIRSLDTDGDQSLNSSELPSSPLDVDMLGPMLDWQDYAKADASTRDEDNKRIVASLFERADVDGDGFLSKDEMEAERTLRRTRWLEGQATDADPVFLINVDADQDRLSPEDFVVLRSIPFDHLKVTPPENLPVEVREAMQKMEEWKNSPDDQSDQKPLTEEERRQQAVDSVLNAPLTATYIGRLLAQLSAAVAKTDPANTLKNSRDGTVA